MVKNLPVNARNVGLIPGLGSSPGPVIDSDPLDQGKLIASKVILFFEYTIK